MKMKLLNAIGVLTTLLALAAASQACLLVVYQPKVPKNLNR